MKQINFYETKNRQKYFPDRKFCEIHRNDKIYNRFDLYVELMKHRRKKNKFTY
jgi:hypothetical protein